MTRRNGKYRVRRLGPHRFRVVNPAGRFVENDKGNPSHYATYEQAIAALRKYERGHENEPDLLVDYDDMEADW
jgi:hypothetical protein